jgi:hypothetical protein
MKTTRTRLQRKISTIICHVGFVSSSLSISDRSNHPATRFNILLNLLQSRVLGTSGLILRLLFKLLFGIFDKFDIMNIKFVINVLKIYASVFKDLSFFNVTTVINEKWFRLLIQTTDKQNKYFDKYLFNMFLFQRKVSLKQWTNI